MGPEGKRLKYDPLFLLSYSCPSFQLGPEVYVKYRQTEGECVCVQVANVEDLGL